jgi:hypothetical protein
MEIGREIPSINRGVAVENHPFYSEIIELNGLNFEPTNSETDITSKRWTTCIPTRPVTIW